MVDLEFTVDGQKLIRNDTLLVANKSKNVISALFNFIDESDEIKIAIFSNIEKSYSCILDEDNRCIIPEEVMLGSFFIIGLAIGDRLTTNALKVFMEYSNYTDDLYESSSKDDGLLFVIQELENKSDIGHLHEIGDIQCLEDELNNKTNINHVHNSSDIEDLDDTLGIDVKRALNQLTNSIRGFTP